MFWSVTESSGGSFMRIALIVSAAEPPEKARLPDSISYRIAPKEKMSDRVRPPGRGPVRGTCSRSFRAPLPVPSPWEAPSAACLLLGLNQLCQPEVQDLDASILRDEEVLGLQVPVHDPLLVGGGEAVRDLDRVFDRLPLGQRAGGDPPPQRFPFEQLRDDIGSSLVRPDVVHRHDVGVVQDAGRARLLLESLQPVRVLRERGRQDLDRHFAPESRIPRPVHLSHPSRPERRQDLVGAESRSRGECHEQEKLSVVSDQASVLEN